MAPWGVLIRALLVMEDAIVSRILRSPGFHDGVRRIHRRVEDYRHGRNPHEPLRPGEATEDPNMEKGGFIRYFIDELRNQARGNPTNPPPSSRPPQQPKK